MKILKNSAFTFIFGAIIFMGIGVYAGTKIQAEDIEYAPNVSVKDKIDDLYTKVKPSYTGTTTVTPSTSKQTLATNGKLLNSNITINEIPSTYKNLTTTTTITSGDILNGKTAYTSDGDLITGTNSTTSLTTKLNFSVTTSQQTFNLGYQPDYIYCILSNGTTNVAHILYNKDYNASQISYATTTGTNNAPRLMNLSEFYTISSFGFTFNFYTNTGTWVNANVNCTASK